MSDRRNPGSLFVGMLGYLCEVHLPPHLTPCGLVLTLCLLLRGAAVDFNTTYISYIKVRFVRLLQSSATEPCLQLLCQVTAGVKGEVLEVRLFDL